MRSSATSGHPQPTAPGQSSSTGRAALDDLSTASIGDAADALSKKLLSRPRQVALNYAIAGAVYALIMAVAQLRADGLEILPVRFLFLFWVFVWPVVPTIGIVAASTRTGKGALTLLYFLGLIAISAVAMALSPELTWSQAWLAWIMFDLPATVLLLTCLSPRIRAVGPLILTFLLLALTGSDVAVSIASSRDSYLRAFIDLTDLVGLGAVGTFIALLATGFLMFAVLGWAALQWIGRRYQAKKMSDESVTVDSVWMLFGVVHSVNLVFGHPLWALAGVVAFLAYKTSTRVGFTWLARRGAAASSSPTLLVLRSFSIGKASERLFDVIGRHWRRVGSVQMIAGVDLLSRTVEPHEFLEFVSGRLSRRFIDGEASLNLRMQERDMAPDRDLRYRVNEFFCYDDTWKSVLSRLVHESDAVLMDLRGFSRENAGCVFELHELARLVPMGRVVFITDRRTDEKLLADTLGAGRAGVFRYTTMRARELSQLMRALAAAATPLPRVGV
jgi:hypothetical protein